MTYQLTRWRLLLAAAMMFATTAVAGAASVSGLVFTDRDCDGIKQAIDPAMTGWKVYLRGVVNGLPPVLDSALTNYDGVYSFGGLAEGDYAVSIQQQSGFLQSTPHSVDYRETVVVTDVLTDRNFSLKLISTCDTIPTYSCTGGTDDSFDTGNGPEPSSPSAELHSAMTTCGTPLAFFDQPATDACFGHTFSNCWSACGPISAVVTVRLRASTSGSQDDELILGDWPSPGSIWRASLSTLLEIKTGGADVSWDPGDTMTVSLDLANLPVAHRGLTNIMAALQDGDLDLLLRNNTEIDFAGDGGGGG